MAQGGGGKSGIYLRLPGLKSTKVCFGKYVGKDFCRAMDDIGGGSRAV